MEQLLKSNFLLLDIVVLLSLAVMGDKLDERKRVTLIYVFSFCLAAADTRFRYVFLGSTVVLLVLLEYLTPDSMRISLFTNILYKLRDFFYRLFIELGYGYFVLSVALVRFVPPRLGHAGYAKGLAVALGVAFLLRALHLLASPSFKSADITKIIGVMDKRVTIYNMETSNHVRELLAMLAAFEDHSYFTRKDTSHTILGRGLLARGKGYIAAYGWKRVFRALAGMFRRGYSTIEMQLVRSVGVEIGSTDRTRDKLRRKIFELCYTGMIINGYWNFLERGRGGYTSRQYREYIARQYIDSVDVKINSRIYRAVAHDKSTLLQLFPRTDINHISKEEFFVWCLGLPYYDAIGPVAVRMHADVLHGFGIQEGDVLQLVAGL